jgi:hypothetical protein
VTKRVLTFAVSGPMRGWYCELEADSETIIRRFAVERWPRDWARTYSPEEFEPQIERFGLRLLCSGWIEDYERKTYFHEARAALVQGGKP